MREGILMPQRLCEVWPIFSDPVREICSIMEGGRWGDLGGASGECGNSWWSARPVTVVLPISVSEQACSLYTEPLLKSPSQASLTCAFWLSPHIPLNIHIRLLCSLHLQAPEALSVAFWPPTGLISPKAPLPSDLISTFSGRKWNEAEGSDCVWQCLYLKKILRETEGTCGRSCSTLKQKCCREAW